MFDAATFLKTLSTLPGVYQMFNDKHELIYVGKAKNLKKRVTSYFLRSQQSTKTQSLVKQIADIKVIITTTENEALLLEINLIKKHHPRYNVIFRDDKTYPYIYLSSHHKFPRFDFYRGPRKKTGKFFGPYPSILAVRHTLDLVKKLFKIRQCKDTFFSNRTRPCLQYQINRCTAPCVNYISQEDYQSDIKHAVMLLEGKTSAIVDVLQDKMRHSAEHQSYEEAARYRDQIAAIREIQSKQYIETSLKEVDVLAVIIEQGVVCLQLLMIRQGQVMGKHSYFPDVATDTDEITILNAFLSQHYLAEEQAIPAEILLAVKLPELNVLKEALSAKAQRNIILSVPKWGDKKQLLSMAMLNAREALNSHLLSQSHLLNQFELLQTILKLPQLPERIECFDISHMQGEATVASCVVFGLNGAIKSDYRRFNITDIQAGDDYAALHQALSRRYYKIKEEQIAPPDIVLIDGGKNQLQQAIDVFAELELPVMALLGIAKGRSRKPGFETIFIANEPQALVLPPDSRALHLLQQVRDEAHRFAITGHRQKRAKSRRVSLLEDIPGIGPKRRQELLSHFGGLQGVKKATVETLSQVPSISHKLAQEIFASLNK